MLTKAKLHLTNTAAVLAACIAFSGIGYAADTEQFGSPPASPPPNPAPGMPVFETPPMPGFMLRKPEKPLTIEEMKQQADEAAEKARRARAAGGAGSTTSGADAESAGNSSKQPVK